MTPDFGEVPLTPEAISDSLRIAMLASLGDLGTAGNGIQVRSVHSIEVMFAMAARTVWFVKTYQLQSSIVYGREGGVKRAPDDTGERFAC